MNIISKENLFDFANLFIKKSKDEIYSIINGSEIHKLDKNKILIKGDNPKTFTIILDFDNEYIRCLTYSSIHEVSIADLIAAFGFYRKVYVPYDDKYHLFFNENYAKGKFTIKVLCSDIEQEKSNKINLLQFYFT